MQSRLCVVTFLLSFMFLSSLYFVNALYFTLILMLTSIVLSVYSVYMGFMSSLFVIMLIIIYVGAIIIFIGYICAISPNMLFVSNSRHYLVAFSPLPIFFFCSSLPTFNSNSHPVTDFLYSSSGVRFFVLISLVLFFVLIVVSSQFFRPQGPFRSVS